MMSMRDNELARRREGRLELRSRPLRVRWNFLELVTADGHELRATFTCSARALPDATERRMLEEVLLGSRYEVSDEDVGRHFQPAMNAAAMNAAQKHPVAKWLSEGVSGELTEAIRAAAVTVAFDCGVELLPPFTLDLQSPSFQQQQLRARQHAMAEQQTAEQIEHVQRAAELLKQFQAMQASSPDLSPGRVLQQISTADRGAVLQTLLLASSKQDRPAGLWAVAGPYLVRIDRIEGTAQSKLYPLPPALGPLRSVQPAVINGRRKLLVGARGGFMAVDPENPTDAQLFQDSPPVESALGFNRVVFRGDRHGYAASHGAAGIVFWQGDKADAPTAWLRPEKFGWPAAMEGSSPESRQVAGPRNLEVMDDATLIFSAGGKLIVTEGQEIQLIQTPSTAEIIAILPEDRRMIVIHEDGTICAVERATREVTCIIRRSARLRSAGLLPWLGSARLLLAEEQGPVQCIGLDDPLVTEYQSQHLGLRMIAGADDLVAGISSDRQRLLLWNSWDGRHPVAEIYLTGMTRHRIADMDFG